MSQKREQWRPIVHVQRDGTAVMVYPFGTVPIVLNLTHYLTRK